MDHRHRLGCDLLPCELAPGVRLRRVPLSILLGEEEWVDGPELDRERFLAAMEAHRGRSSSPVPPLKPGRRRSPGTAPSSPSPSRAGCREATTPRCSAATWSGAPARKPIYVLDSRSAGAEITLLVRKACELIAQGLDFEEVTKRLWLYHQHTHLLFLLEHVDNLRQKRPPEQAGGRGHRHAGRAHPGLRQRARAPCSR